jgi:A/G-specific adenine glycosylase
MSNTVETARRAVLRWYAENGRHWLPWRSSLDPYELLVAEFMLQQTTTAQVALRWRPFLWRFPDLASLASAGDDDVEGAWDGLGLNKRAAALRRAAETMLEYWGGVPADPSALETVPGIGPYTAGAVAATAFGVPAVAVDVNVERAAAALLPRMGDPAEAAKMLMDRKDPRRWLYAIVDYGSIACKITKGEV